VNELTNSERLEIENQHTHTHTLLGSEGKILWE